MNKYLSKLKWILAVSIIMIALIVSAIRALTPYISQYKPSIEKQLSEKLSVPVHIGSIATDWYWWMPVLYLSEVKIGENGPEIKDIKVGINLWSSLISRQLKPGLVYLSGMKAKAVYVNSTIQLTGFIINNTQSSILEPINIIIKNSQIELSIDDSFHSTPQSKINSNLINILDANVKLRSNQDLQGEVNFNVLDTYLTSIFKFNLNDDARLKVAGDSYFSIRHADIKKWMDNLPIKNFKTLRIQNGSLDGSFWISLNNDGIQDVIARMSMSNLRYGNAKIERHIPYISANLGIAHQDSTWAIKANQIELITDKRVWPINALEWTHGLQDKLSINTVELHSLMALAEPFMPSLVAYKNLDATLKNVSIYWSHTNQRVSNSDSHSVQTEKVAPKDKPRGEANTTNGIAENKDSQDSGYQSLILNKLALNFEKGTYGCTSKTTQVCKPLLEELYGYINYENEQFNLVASNAIGHIESHLSKNSGDKWPFVGSFSLDAKNAEKLLPLLPSNYIKPKLFHWLTHDIYHMGEAHIKGSIDATQGLLINGKIQNLNLAFAPDWPHAEHINADLQVTDQSLNASIHQAKLGMIPVKNIQLEVTGLGGHQEEMNIKGDIATTFSEALAYIQKTPLLKKVDILNHIHSPQFSSTNIASVNKLGVSLDLKFFLYPTKQKDKVLGKIKFANNTVLLAYDGIDTLMQKIYQIHWQDKKLSSISGYLGFDEKGLINSNLSAKLATMPMQFNIDNPNFWTLSWNFKGQNKLILKPKDANQYDFIINTTLSNGEGRYIVNPLQIDANLNTLNWPNFSNVKKNEPKSIGQPQNWPIASLSIQDAKVGNTQLGFVNLKAHPTQNAWVVDELNVKNNAYEAFVSGHWSIEAQNSSTKFKLDMKTKKLSKALEALSLSKAAEALSASLKFDGGWPGDLTSFSLSALSGQGRYEMSNGRIIEVSSATEGKLDIARVFSLLSIQTIPRRLRLDFSDLTKDGFSFDKSEGDFMIKNGVFNTENTYVVGPIAYIGLKGNIDLEAQKYDLDMRVSPYLTASIPIAATIAGGPIAGVAAYMATKIINSGMQKIDVYGYHISGPWAKPIVKRLGLLLNN